MSFVKGCSAACEQGCGPVCAGTDTYIAWVRSNKKASLDEAGLAVFNPKIVIIKKEP
jgi:hypothetical protein